MEDSLRIVIGSCFVAVGLATAAFFCVRLYQAFASRRWPFTIGELESSDLKLVVYRGREVGGGPDEASAMVVDFSYRYRVGEQRFNGKRVTFSDGINKTMRALKKLQQAYQDKSEIRVYYNPARPAQSVLVPGPSLFNFTPLITSGLFVAVGIFIFTFDFT